MKYDKCACLEITYRPSLWKTISAHARRDKLAYSLTAGTYPSSAGIYPSSADIYPSSADISLTIIMLPDDPCFISQQGSPYKRLFTRLLAAAATRRNFGKI